MIELKMKQIIPKFSSEAEEAAWWHAHRSEIDAGIRQGLEQGNLAERLAREINERAARMTAEERTRADSETKKIAAQVRR